MDKNQIIKKIISGFLATLHYLVSNVQFFTVLFFIIVFSISIWVWWECFYKSKPSPAVITRVEESREDFKSMQERIEKVVLLLREKERNFQNVSDFSSQREIFMEIKAAVPVEAEDAGSEDGNSSEEAVSLGGESATQQN